MVKFRNAFVQFCHDADLSAADWTRLNAIAYDNRLDINEALAYVRGDSLHFLERVLSFAYADGVIDPHEERNVIYLLRSLAIPENLAGPILDRLAYMKRLSEIHQGRLPTVLARVHLDSDEICHMEMSATYHKVNARSITHQPGMFVATSKRLHFLSEAGGAEIQWKRVMRVLREGEGIYLELSTKKGNGHYDVQDPYYAEAVINALVRMSKRQLVAGDRATRHIPQDVKQAVWQRDQGKCTQCAATSYLEFDHIIPFNKGGATSVNNLQLLCRRCNLAKRDRI